MSLARYLKPVRILFTSKPIQKSTLVRSIHTTPIMSASVEDGHPPKSRSAARIPGPVEQSMQTKVCTVFPLLQYLPSCSPSSFNPNLTGIYFADTIWILIISSSKRSHRLSFVYQTTVPSMLIIPQCERLGVVEVRLVSLLSARKASSSKIA